MKGKTASEMVHQVLQKVPNPQHDPDVDQINMIRSSLSALASNNTGLAWVLVSKLFICNAP